MVMDMTMVKYMGMDKLINIHVREIVNNVMIVDMFMLMATTKFMIKYTDKNDFNKHIICM